MSKYHDALCRIIDEYIPMHYEGKPMNQQTEDALTLQELVDKEIELESRKEKLVVGSEWVCLVDCLCSVDDNKKQRKVGLIKKGSKFKIYEFIEVLGRVTIKEPLKFDIPIDQFLLCFKPR